MFCSLVITYYAYFIITDIICLLCDHRHNMLFLQSRTLYAYCDAGKRVMHYMLASLNGVQGRHNVSMPSFGAMPSMGDLFYGFDVQF